MDFSANSYIIYIIVAIIILVVVAQSVFFLIKAIKRAKEINIPKEKIKKTITTAAIFTIAPAVSILVGVVTLSVSLGIPLPWLRLSIIGSLSYETVAASVAQGSLGLDSATLVTNASDFVTIAWVMTIGIILGLILVPILTKKVQSGMMKMEAKDKKWGEIFNNAMFLGMISAFLGYVFCDVTNLFRSNEWLLAHNTNRTAGLIPVCVMITSAIAMCVCGLLSKKFNKRWITDYALPFSLICGMAAAIPFTIWLG